MELDEVGVATHMLLEQATADRDSLHRQIEGALSSAAALLQAGKLHEAIELLLSQPQGVQRSPRLQVALTALQEERQQALYRMAGRAYAGLDGDLRWSDVTLKRAAIAAPNSTFFATLGQAFLSRGRKIADQTLSEALHKSKELVRGRDKDALERLLQSAAGSVAYAGSELQAEWQSVTNKAPRGTGSAKRPR